VKRAAERAFLITDAERSQDDQLRRRQVRYVLMMGLRALCLVLAALLATLKVPLLWLWIVLCLAGMVLLPWFAVLLANDRPPKERHRLRQHQPEPSRPLVLPTARAESDPEPRVIDAEE
jgi:Flp pilus assembly protein TadB